MKLSDGEKLILLMLSDICEKLKVDGTISPIVVKKAIIHDHLWALKREYDRVFFNKSDPHAAKQVVDILNMWTITE